MVLENILRRAFGQPLNQYGSVKKQLRGVQIVIYTMLMTTAASSYSYTTGVHGPPDPFITLLPIPIAITSFGTVIGALRWYYLSRMENTNTSNH